MPLQNVNIQVNQSVVIHSNPKDAPGNNSSLPSGVSWAEDTNLFGSIAPQGADSRDCKFTAAGGGLGVTTLLMACEGRTAQYQVTTVAGPFDHFAPTNDPPTTP